MLTFEQVDYALNEFFKHNKTDQFKVGYVVYMNENFTFHVRELNWVDDDNGNCFLYHQFEEKAFVLHFDISESLYQDKKYLDKFPSETLLTPLERTYYERGVIPLYPDKFEENYFRNQGNVFFIPGTYEF